MQGIHYREAERPAAPLALLPGLTQSSSFHALGDVAVDWGGLSYAMLSPIFDSISKPGYRAAAFDSDDLKSLLSRTCPHLPVAALGGVTPSNVGEVSRGWQAAW